MPQYFQTALTSPPFATLTYALSDYLKPEAVAPGMRVLVPVGGSTRVAVVLGGAAEAELPEGVEVKELIWPLEHAPMLDAAYLATVRDLSLRQLVEEGRVLHAVIPKPLRSSDVRYTYYGELGPRTYTAKSLKGLAEKGDPVLTELGAGWLSGRMQLSLPAKDSAREEGVQLAVDPPWTVRPNARVQRLVLDYLYEHGERGAVSREHLRDVLGPEIATALKTLAARQLIRIGPLETLARENLCPPEATDEGRPLERSTGFRGHAGFSLNQAQAEVLAKATQTLERSLAEGRAGVRLLHGVTGSGKTAVYLELAQRCLEAGRSAFLLAPEVALACRLRDAVEGYFGNSRTLFFHHGYQPPTLRARTFARAAAETHDHPVLVVGTRSALFLPVRNPGLVILDEEHDGSFKQDEGLAYQAKEVGYVRVGSGGLLLLGSATPDVKTFQAAAQGQIERFILDHRVASARPPSLELVNLAPILPGGRPERLLAPTAGGTGLTPAASEALLETVARGEQAVILLNRRGYAPLMYCQDCLETLTCPDCAIGLTYHKGQEKLVCHYCGGGREFPAPCPNCGGASILPMGEGTEKLEEDLAATLAQLPELGDPAKAVLRMDRDATRRPGRLEEILASFARREASVLVGTQMLSKGHHFPEVTLVVVADGDLGLNLPDYRGRERSFQLMVQVAGRAGRGEKPGRVLIQTRDPKASFWEHVLAQDYAGFFAQELTQRERYGYPPFVKLALVELSYPMQQEDGMAHVAALAEASRAAGRPLGVTVRGPAPAPIPFARGRKRFHVLLKGADWSAIRAVFGHVRTALGRRKDVRLSLDVDPVNML